MQPNVLGNMTANGPAANPVKTDGFGKNGAGKAVSRAKAGNADEAAQIGGKKAAGEPSGEAESVFEKLLARLTETPLSGESDLPGLTDKGASDRSFDADLARLSESLDALLAEDTPLSSDQLAEEMASLISGPASSETLAWMLGDGGRALDTDNIMGQLKELLSKNAASADGPKPIVSPEALKAVVEEGESVRSIAPESAFAKSDAAELFGKGADLAGKDGFGENGLAEAGAAKAPAMTTDARPVQAPGPVSFQDQVLQQITEKAHMKIADGQSEIRIELKPPTLGTVRLHIVTENQQVSLRVVAEVPMVRELIEQNIGQLRADLTEQGLDLGFLDVMSDDGSGESDQPGGQGDGAEDGSDDFSGVMAGVDPGDRTAVVDADGRIHLRRVNFFA